MTFNWGKYQVLRKKREEREKIQRAGGGHELAKRILMNKSTDFNYGANDPQPQPEPAERETTEPERCMGRTVCQRCKKFHGYCVEVEELAMLPTGNESSQSGARNGRRQSNQVWLKNEDLGTDVREALIHDVRYNKDGKYGARVEMKLIMAGKTLFWGVPPKVDDKNPNYKELLEAFGPDENNWVQKKIGIFLEQDAWSGNYFPRVVILNSERTPEPEPTPASQRTPRGSRVQSR